ncbi:hypothetical protein ACLKA7_011665 [Drosophila subpalustris]
MWQQDALTSITCVAALLTSGNGNGIRHNASDGDVNVDEDVGKGVVKRLRTTVDFNRCTVGGKRGVSHGGHVTMVAHKARPDGKAELSDCK